VGGGGDAAVSHRDLVSIIPYSSVTTAHEDDDKITPHCDPRRPKTQAAEQSSSLDRHEAIRALVGLLEHSMPDDGERPLSVAVEANKSSPGCRMTLGIM